MPSLVTAQSVVVCMVAPLKVVLAAIHPEVVSIVTIRPDQNDSWMSSRKASHCQPGSVLLMMDYRIGASGQSQDGLSNGLA